ncbi:PEP-CTERM sorting domain-containing protein, partial [Acinetobacter baumannii]
TPEPFTLVGLGGAAALIAARRKKAKSTARV